MLAALATVIAVALAGCGLGPGPVPTGVHLTVTRDFGSRQVHQTSLPHLAGSETVMSLLMRNAKVSTRYSGGFVQSLDGLSGGREAGEPIDWFYYVNGVQASKGAAETNVHRGERIWWDLHDWGASDNVPAVVGSFPEPFLGGIEGKRLPVRVECASLTSEPCTTVTSQLRRVGVLAGGAAIGPGDEPETLRVMVGTWAQVRGDPATLQIQQGPAASGVYAKFSGDGSTLTLLNERGQTARTLTAGAGLVAATRYGEEAPLWVITGTDAAGVTLAARAFTETALRDHFAVALAPGGAELPIPLAG